MVLCTYVISPVARPGPTLPYQAVQLCYSSKQETEMINTEHLYEYSIQGVTISWVLSGIMIIQDN